MISQVSQSLGKKIRSISADSLPIGSASTKSDVMFLPYAAADCILLHTHFARRLQSNHGINPALKYDIHWIKAPPAERSFVRSKRLSFRNKMEILFGLSQEKWPVALGMMDHYRRICSINDFFEIGPLDEGALAKVLSAKVTAQDIAEKGKSFILPDLGYTFTRTVHNEAISSGKKVLLLNPHGVFRELPQLDAKILQNPSISDLQEQVTSLPIEEVLHLEKKAREYKAKRLSGKANRDYEAKLAYSGSESTEGLKGKKILFLHCFRDTIRFFPETEVLRNRTDGFVDYFEWTNWALSIISEAPNEWIIKNHPNSDQYDDERLILQRLLELHNLPRKLLLGNVSVKKIINSRQPIFTHSGSVIAEAASVGNKSFSINTGQYPSSMTNALNNVDAEKFYRMSCKELSHFQSLSSKEINGAEMLLFLSSKENRPLFNLMSMHPYKKHRNDYVSLVREMRSYLDLSLKLRSAKGINSMDHFVDDVARMLISK